MIYSTFIATGLGLFLWVNGEYAFDYYKGTNQSYDVFFRMCCEESWKC